MILLFSGYTFPTTSCLIGVKSSCGVAIPESKMAEPFLGGKWVIVIIISVIVGVIDDDGYVVFVLIILLLFLSLLFLWFQSIFLNSAGSFSCGSNNQVKM